MNVVTDNKPTITLNKKATDIALPLADSTQPNTPTQPEKKTSESLREAIKDLNSKPTELVKNTIENIKPGNRLDLSVVRETNKLENKEKSPNRRQLRLAAEKSGPKVQTIAHQIIEI